MCNMALSESQANTLVYALFRLICCRNMFCSQKFLTLVSAFMYNLLKYAGYFVFDVGLKSDVFHVIEVAVIPFNLKTHTGFFCLLILGRVPVKIM